MQADLIALRTKTEKLDGLTPKMGQVNQDPSLPHSQTYVSRYGSWKKACKRAGLVPNTSKEQGYNPELDHRDDS